MNQLELIELARKAEIRATKAKIDDIDKRIKRVEGLKSSSMRNHDNFSYTKKQTGKWLKAQRQWNRWCQAIARLKTSARMARNKLVSLGAE